MNLPILSRWKELVTMTKTGSGLEWKDGVAVPAGKCIIVTAMAAVNWTAGSSLVDCGIVIGTAFYRLASKASPAARDIVVWTGEAIMLPGDKIRIEVDGGTAGNACYLWAQGYYTVLIE